MSVGSDDDDRVDLLVVDDRPDKLLALEVVLAELDQRVQTARSGPEALRLLLQRDFAVILLDVHMPVMDGFETASLVRQRAQSEHTPIIFVTAVSDHQAHVSRGYSLGAVDYIFSPVVPEILRAKVSVFIELHRKNREIARQAEMLRVEAERRAALLERRLDALLVDLEVGVYRAAPDGSLVEANPAFLALIEARDLRGAARADLSALLLSDAERADALARGGARLRRDARLVGRDGAERWVSLSLRVSADGEIDGVVDDITARKAAEQALRTRTDELARSNEELEQFAYIASHDLQEPLRTITAFSTLLVRRHAAGLDEDARAYLGFVSEGAARMHTLIRDLLAYHRSRSDVRALAPTDCEGVVDRALQNLKHALEERGAVITRDPLPVVMADATLLVQLYQNLLSNALKFSREVPTVHVGAARCPEGWRFEVRDSGIGIAPEHQDSIFGMFRRIHPRESFEGNGIGLAICRRIVERHGGRLWVESEVGVGTRFLFVLADAEVPPADDDALRDLAHGRHRSG